MNPQTEENELTQGRYCKAGFWHGLTDDCDHIVSLPAMHVRRKIGNGVALPYDYYSDEAVARRRQENKEKYAPTHRSFNRHRLLAGNDAGELY